MEGLLLALGGAAAKSALSLWIGAVPLLGDVSGVAIDELVNRAPGLGPFERRRAARRFESMAEAVAEKLAPFLETEFGGLGEDEQRASIEAVTRAIERAGISSDLLLANDLDPVRLEAHVSGCSPEAARGLSPAGRVLYAHLLREACNYMVEVAITLPEFVPGAARALLRRETETIELIQRVLDRLPEPWNGGDGTGDLDRQFETQFRRSTARLLDQLELFGLDVSPYAKRYALSVAYITLSATDPRTHGRREATEGPTLRVDEALALADRLLVRGIAGSGKTTLLQWLAVSCARQSFTGELSGLNMAVPFFIRLRRHVDGHLPAPEDFLADVTTALAGSAPHGWVHRQLTAGRALVLVDGVDELPDDGRRQRVRRWLEDLSQEYPSSRFVVTSRSTAADETWLAEAGFRSCTLQPMTLPDVDSFIDHWHEAISTARFGADDAAIGPEATGRERPGVSLAVQLKAKVRSRPALRALATTPLLSAMLCALHRERSEQLPADRMELYRVALELLLERRDIERRIVGADLLSLREKQIILRDLALWLVLNGYVDVDETAARQRVAGKLVAMPRILAKLGTGDPPELPSDSVFTYLLERTGVLRRPADGRVDFVHRTFQEYLAAQEFIDQGHIGLLIARAAEESWREIVVLAAGHARVEQRRELLDGILAAGRSDVERRHRLYLLAAACLETSPEVPVEVMDRLTAALAEVMPPQNMTEALAVASAGEMAVPLLATVGRQRARVTAACLRALALIKGEQALVAIEARRGDVRRAVVEELWRSWEAFDATEYAERVLSATRPPTGEIVVTDPRMLAGLRFLRGIRRLTVTGESIEDLGPLAALQELEELRVVNTGVRDLSPVRGLTHLARLWVDRAPVADLGPVADLLRLDTLAMAHTRVGDLAPVAGLTRLVTLDLHRSEASDLGPLSALTSLRTLHLHGTRVRRISALARLTQLEDLRLGGTGVADIGPLASLTGLRLLDLDRTRVSDLTPLVGLSGLESLGLEDTAVTDISPLAALTQLQALYLQGTGVVDVGPLAHLTRLRRLRLDGTLAAYRGIHPLR